MKKKIASLALVLALCLSLLPMTAFAEEEAEVSAEEPIRTSINTVEDLMQFAEEATEGKYDGKEDAVVSLNADLDLTGKNWVPIAGKLTGNNLTCFSGTFYGNNHVISGLDLSNTYSAQQPYTGFFGALWKAKVYDLTVKGSFTAAESTDSVRGGLGSIAGFADSSIISDCVSEVSFNNDGKAFAGFIGMLGEIHNTLVEYCENKGEFTFTNDMESSYIGGIVGYADDNTEIKYCANTAPMTLLATNSGEIAGSITGQSKIDNCYATGKLTVLGTATMNSVSGIVGTIFTGTSISNSYFAGEFDLSRYSVQPPYGRLGGIGGQITATSNTEVPNFVNFANNYYTQNSNIYACGGDTKIRDGVSAKSADDMKTEGFYKKITEGGGTYRYEEGSTPLLLQPTHEVSFVVTPAELTDVVIKVDGEEVANPAKLENGTHKFTVEAKNCKPFSGKFTVSANPETHTQMVAMTYLPADYAAVDAAIEKANALNEADYRNFDTVKAAIAAVVRDKNITEQDEVDAMAQAIENAITGLVRKSSGSSRPRYDVTTPSKPENGSVTVDPERARSGSRVTVTVTPDSGYKLGELVVTDRDGKKLELTDKGNGQYTFTMPSGKVEVAAEFVKEVEVSPFADVATDAYYYDAVKWAVEKGVTNGVSETLFGPDQACTRAQIVTFLWRAAGSPEPKSGSSFADVAADAYYAKAVAWAVENGITKGTSETTFHPDETCTRAQGVTFLYRALGKLAAAQAGFTDVAADSYYADAVNWAAENGVTKGISETLFGPDGSCTRAQIVTFLYRAYQGK